MGAQYPPAGRLAKGANGQGIGTGYLSSVPLPVQARPPRLRRVLAPPLVALAVLAAVPHRQGAAQPRTLDVGSYSLLVAGQRVGREQFSIQRMAGVDGAVLELRAEAAIGERRTALRLEVDSAGTPVRVAMNERVGTEQTLRLGGQRVRGRLATLSRSRAGEAGREYLLRPGAVVLEEDGVVLHALLIPQLPVAEGDGVTLPSLTPTANTQGTVRVVLEAAADSVTLAGRRQTAARWRVTTSSGEVRLIWADADRRILRVTVPGRGFEARRDDAPR